MIRAAFRAERRRQAHARAKIRISAPRTKVQECPRFVRRRRLRHCRDEPSTLAPPRAGGRARTPVAGRLSWLSTGDGRWRCRGAALTPCRCVTCTGTRARVTSAAPSETEGPGSSSTRACEVGRASATAPAADGSTRALTGAATGADAAGEPATLSAGALLAVTGRRGSDDRLRSRGLSRGGGAHDRRDGRSVRRGRRRGACAATARTTIGST